MPVPSFHIYVLAYFVRNYKLKLLTHFGYCAYFVINASIMDDNSNGFRYIRVDIQLKSIIYLNHGERNRNMHAHMLTVCVCECVSFTRISPRVRIHHEKVFYHFSEESDHTVQLQQPRPQEPNVHCLHASGFINASFILTIFVS